jgi:hypothetical protein
MRFRLFTVVTAMAVALAVVAAFGTAAGARAARPTLGHRGHAAAAVRTDRTLVSLYNQNNHPQGFGISSQNFEPVNDAYDAAGADDFKVKAGQTWKVKEVDVTGFYFNGAGPADSETVTFYQDAGGLPGAVKKTYKNVAGTDDGAGSFVITLPKPLRLTQGHYWVSVVINMNFDPGGQWAWMTRTASKGTEAAWQNPGDGFGTGCTTWGNMFACAGDGQSGTDFLFALFGAQVA